MLRVAPWRQMQIHIVAENCGGNNGIAFVILSKFLEVLVQLAVDDGVFFDPADLALLGFDLVEPPPVLDHFKSLPIRHFGYAIGYSSHSIVQVHLPRRHVHRVVLFWPDAIASRNRNNHSQNKPCT